MILIQDNNGKARFQEIKWESVQEAERFIERYVDAMNPAMTDDEYYNTVESWNVYVD